MEFIGKNLPNIQAQYSSTLDTVKSGIQETARTAGLAGLESAFENFLSNTLGNQGTLDPQSWVGNVAQFPNPSTFLRAHTQMENPEIATEQLLKYVGDPKFEPAAELKGLLDRLFPEPTPIQGEAKRQSGTEAAVGQNSGIDPSLFDEFSPISTDIFRRQDQMPLPIQAEKEMDTDRIKTKFEALKETPISGGQEIDPDIAKSKFQALKEGNIQGEAPHRKFENWPEWYKQFDPAAKVDELLRGSKFYQLKQTPISGEKEIDSEVAKSKFQALKETAIQGEKNPINTTSDSQVRPKVEQTHGPISDAIGRNDGTFHNKDNIIQGQKEIDPEVAKSKFQALKERPIQGETTPAGDSTKTILQWMADFENEKQKEIEDKMKEMEAQIDARKAFAEFKNLPFTEPEGKSETREKASTPASKDSQGSVGQADQRGIIIVGGMPQDAAAQRGIIIVGGKTEGTYFQTINDTIQQLNTEPKPETLTLFKHQASSVQEMTFTAREAVQLQQQVTAQTLTKKIW